MNNKEFFAAMELMEKEKGIPAEYLAEKIANAIVVSLRKEYNGKDVVFCDIDFEKQKIKVFWRREVVEEVEDPDSQISLAEVSEVRKRIKVGDVYDVPLDTKKLGYIAAQTAKHVFRQGVREAERGQILKEYQSKNQEIVTANVLRIDPKTGNATLEIGKSEAILPRGEQVPGEILNEGDQIKVFIVDVRESEKGPKIMISRTHPNFVLRLFEMEVPEIFDGTVEIKAVSREAGSRTKIAVSSKDDEIDAIGACIGNRGARVNKIVDELGGEKIDIVLYSDDPAMFISEALKPATVLKVEILEDEDKACKVTVPDTQLSLAIGNKGQNARLAARLTGWKIDIRPESGFFGE